jgi:choline-sulfatase
MTKKKNIILLVSDQFRGDCLASDGNEEINTPNYDKLAERGARFKNAFTPCPICVPARATMISGNYPHKCTGTKDNDGALRDDQIELPDLLAKNGYSTYSSGKLHYLPYAGPGESRTLHGFQKAKLTESGRILAKYDPLGQMAGLEDYFDYLDEIGWSGFSRAHGVGNNDIHPAPSPLPGEHTVDAWVASEAIAYVDEHLQTNSEKPFFLNVSFPKPHAPFDPPRPYDSLYSPLELSPPYIQKDALPRAPGKQTDVIEYGWEAFSPESKQVIKSYYYGLISFQDAQVGRILEHLESKGILEDTYILFVGDHGEMLGDFGYYFKSCLYEGSVRVPFLISGPGISPIISDSLVGLQDLTPTIAELASIDLPTAVDGISLLPILNGEQCVERDAYIAYCLDSPKQTYMVRTKTHKYIYNELDAIEELYVLSDDPHEEHNCIDDSSMVGIRAKLRQQLIDWAIDNGDTQMISNGDLSRSDFSTDKSSFNASRLGWRHY